MRIGVIGSGIAGLTSAWLLGKQGHQVTVFEKCDRIGMDARAVDLKGAELDRAIDVPARLLNHAQWPNLLALYKQLGVSIAAVEHTQSYGHVNGETFLNVDLAKLFGLATSTILSKWGQCVVSDAVRLKRQGKQDLNRGISNAVSLSQYLRDGAYSREFQFGFLYPVLATTVCTCSYQALDRYPAHVVLDILDRLTIATRPSSRVLWRAKFGSADVAERLLSYQPELRLGARVETITCKTDGMELVSRPTPSPHSEPVAKGEASLVTHTESFDHVVMATQANHAKELLPQSMVREYDALSRFHYETVEVTVHSDPRLMPSQQKNWATFNMMAVDNVQPDNRDAMCSIWVNRFDPSLKLPGDVFQTINPILPPDPELTWGQHQMQRPIVDQRSFSGWKALEQLRGDPARRLWFVGSYAEQGVPLLETGVVSSQKVAAAIASLESNRPSQIQSSPAI